MNCPACYMSVSENATRCPYCTTKIEKYKVKGHENGLYHAKVLTLPSGFIFWILGGGQTWTPFILGCLIGGLIAYLEGRYLGRDETKTKD